MEPKDFDDLTKRYKLAMGGEAKVSIPPGADGVDIAEYLRLAKNAKQLLSKATAAQDRTAASKLANYLDVLKRVARARAMQRELGRLDGNENPFVTPFPELDPHLQSSRFGR
jgi:hypothetical protein